MSIAIERSGSVGVVYGFETHSTPLECENLGIEFSIDIALLWSAGTQSPSNLR